MSNNRSKSNADEDKQTNTVTNIQQESLKSSNEKPILTQIVPSTTKDDMSLKIPSDIRRQSLPVENQGRLLKTKSTENIGEIRMNNLESPSGLFSVSSTPFITPYGSISSLVSSLNGSLQELDLKDLSQGGDMDIYKNIERFFSTLDDCIKGDVEEEKILKNIEIENTELVENNKLCNNWFQQNDSSEEAFFIIYTEKL